jgi:folate-binding protein YgfZ
MSFFAHVSGRHVFRASGSDAWAVIKNLTTIDGPGYCHWLNAQGRILFEGFVEPIEEDWLIEVDAALVPQFKKHFALYSLRKKVSLVDELVYNQVLHVSGSSSLAASGMWFEDHRLLEKCWRVYCENDREVASQLPRRDSRYDTHKVLSGCAEGVAVLQSGKNFSLECNLERMGGVSFDKGCYLGQELVSRSHFVGVVRKRLMAVVAGTEEPPFLGAGAKGLRDAIKFLETSSTPVAPLMSAGMEVVDEKGKECGSVFGVGSEFPNLALAMLRLQQVEERSAMRLKDGTRIWPLRLD